MPRWPDQTLVERVYARIVRRGSNECWGWRGSMSRSRFRQKLVRYPNIAADGTWKVRVNRLLLILRGGPLDHPEREGEAFLAWLRRVWPEYRFQQAAHSCDNSECVNPGHLEWATREQNLNEQWQRKRAEAEAGNAA